MDDKMSSPIELWISARDLKSLDLLSKSDPFVVVCIRDPRTLAVTEIGRTETIQNNHNPDFKARIKLTYHFEEVQELMFKVYDSDSNSPDLSQHDYMGDCICTVADLVVSPDQCLQLPLIKYRGLAKEKQVNKGKSKLVVRCEEVDEGAAHSFISFNLRGAGLDKKDIFGSSDPYLQIFKMAMGEEKERWIEVYKTETIMNNLNPQWQAFSLPLSDLCNGDLNRPIRITVMDWDRHTSHDLIGHAETTVNELVRYGQAPSFVLIHPKKQKKKGASYMRDGSGRVVFDKPVQIVREHTFLDFIKGGMSVSLMVAIDFTGSNGHPQDPRSLHSLHDNGRNNQYIQAIKAVGSILMPYDSDQLVPVWGFGAKLPDNRVSHCFNLNFEQNPEVRGVQGILDAYKASFQHIRLSGPTLFSEVISVSNSIAQSIPQYDTASHYSILLILTDGTINDQQQTIAEIVKASSSPLSIIIVGVGDADFSQMEALDSDDSLLTDRFGNKARRDIVQFVPFRKFARYGAIDLAGETLAEVPRQVVDWAKDKRLTPGLGVPANHEASAPPMEI